MVDVMTTTIRVVKVGDVYRYCCYRLANVTHWDRIGCAHVTPGSAIAHTKELESRVAPATESELRAMYGDR